MPSDIKGASAEELRLRNYRQQLQNRHELELRDMRDRQGDEVLRLHDNFNHQTETLREAYDVQISEEAEQLEDRLQQLRTSHAERVSSEKKAGDEEVSQLRAGNRQQVDETRKNGEAQIAALRKQYQDAADVLHKKARKSAKRDQEVPST